MEPGRSVCPTRGCGGASARAGWRMGAVRARMCGAARGGSGRLLVEGGACGATRGGADVSSSSRQARGAKRVGAAGAARKCVGDSKQAAVVGEEYTP